MPTPLDASISDLLRLLVVPVFAWAAWRDVETRRIPNRTWYPLAALALVLLAWDGWEAWTATPFETRLFAIRVAVSLGFVAPLVLAFWWFRAFGGADAKAFLVVAALFPTFPSYAVGGWYLPHQQTLLGVFSLTILTNTVLIGALYPLSVLVRNAAAGRFSSAMFVGKPVRWDAIPREHGRLLETPDGVTRNGVDLDAIRMYLRWRGTTLADVRERADRLRDPASLPAEPNPPGDGAVAVTDARADGVSASSEGRSPSDRSSGQRPREDEASGGSSARSSDGGERPRADESAGETVSAAAEAVSRDDAFEKGASEEDASEEDAPENDAPHDDPWGAAAFLADIDHGAYGTTPEKLRDGLDVLAAEEEVWVSPGIPFVVPLFVGTVVALTYGDLLFGLLALVGLA